MNLYQLDNEWEAIQEELEALDGQELTPELELKLLELMSNLDETAQEWHRKVDNYCKLIAGLNASAKARKAESDRLKELAGLDQIKADRLKERLKDSLKLRDQYKVKTTLFNLSVCKNSRPSLIVPETVHEVEKLPDEFTKLVKEPDKEAIKEALESGQKIEGCQLAVGDHLRIK